MQERKGKDASLNDAQIDDAQIDDAMLDDATPNRHAVDLTILLTPMKLALFDLDHTLLPLDSDYEWSRFLVGRGVVDADWFATRNDYFYTQYKAGTLNIDEFLAFQLAPLAKHPRQQLDRWHRSYMESVIEPAIGPEARGLVQGHRQAGDLCAIVTATNEFVTRPIAHAFGIEHLIAITLETENGDYTGRYVGVPSFKAGKVLRCDQWLHSLGHRWEDFEETWFYSDSLNDIPLLERASHPVATNPDPTLEQWAKDRACPILRLFS